MPGNEQTRKFVVAMLLALCLESESVRQPRRLAKANVAVLCLLIVSVPIIIHMFG
jgi:hypothetical protein